MSLARPALPRHAGLARPHAIAWALMTGWGLLAAAPTLAADTAALDPVVVTGGTRAQALAEAPYAISAVSADELRSAGPLVNLSEALGRVPGLLVANRNNYAQDLQISSRGFGARAGFGVRGLRLYSDGIPATMPDGQGQVAHFDLAGAERIEVLRGPFSALYGNSSGGVIALFTAPVTVPYVDVGADFGRFGLRQQRLGFGQTVGSNTSISASLSLFSTDGFRAHSAADRRLSNLRYDWRGANDRIVFLASDQNQSADDPLGVDRPLLTANPLGTAPQADQFRTRKTIRQTQFGTSWTHGLDLGPIDSLTLTAYQGSRGVVQYLAIPNTTQNGVRHGGGLIDFDREYRGIDTRLHLHAGPVDGAAGVNVEQMVDQRRGYLSFTTTTPTIDYGNQGALKRDERNQALTREAYGQLDWTLTEAWALSGGVRGGSLDLSNQDHFINATGNGDDSGARRMKYASPAASLKWKPAAQLNTYLSVAHGFEAPTLGELAYQPVATNAGFNTSLQPQTSRQAELGAKWRGKGEGPDLDLAYFDVRTKNEIAVLTNAGGRSSFQNVGPTSRRGAEIGSRWRLSPSFSAQLAVTRLEAKYLSSFTTCRGTPCVTDTARAGNRIAGTQPLSAFGELAWKPDAAGELALELRGQGRTPVNDLNDDHAGAFALANLRYSRRIEFGAADQLELLTRVDNLGNRHYVGSVIVNDGNNRFFEPGAPRTWLASLRWKHSF